jgi:hypothetical protein
LPFGQIYLPSFKLRCTSEEPVEGSAEFTYLGADRYQGKMLMNMRGETMTMAYEGQKLGGACDAGALKREVEQMQANAQRQQAPIRARSGRELSQDGCRSDLAGDDGHTVQRPRGPQDVLLGVSLDTRTIGENLLTQPHALVYLAGQLIRVFNGNADSQLPVVSSLDITSAAPCAVWLCIFAAALLNIRKHTVGAFSVLWFLIWLAPTNSLLPRLAIAGSQGQRQPSEKELSAAQFQGDLVARTTAALIAGRAAAQK